MSVLSDHEIIHLAKKKDMIFPFSPKQISRDNTGGKVISYGVSSYGYDARCSDEFKIFTNINSTIVDPKNFDENNFVDFKGPVCIIPPNSFALSSTIESFKIPRDILVICLGKSTYARCFTGDTLVSLVDGRDISLFEMVALAEKGERFFGYTIKIDGSIGVEELLNPRKTAEQVSLVEVELDTGKPIRCTPDHEFLMRDGTYKQAQSLLPEDNLMSLKTNHKVVSVTKLPYKDDVYCLTVPNSNNFALAAGIFVHNCGIIVNVTPLEPEWEGQVTLEFSNTTNLPAKIYANEGVAQFIFLKANKVCDISYADKGGKYQWQTGVTLPR